MGPPLAVRVIVASSLVVVVVVVGGGLKPFQLISEKYFSEFFLSFKTNTAGGDGFNVQFDDSMQRIPTWWKWYEWYGDIQSMLNNGETVAEFITRKDE
ncbi:hypothetical protein CsSME_00051198 [Camellia sinensis var. sinensis]